MVGDSGSGHLITQVMKEACGLLVSSFGMWEHLAPLVFSFSVRGNWKSQHLITQVFCTLVLTKL